MWGCAWGSSWSDVGAGGVVKGALGGFEGGMLKGGASWFLLLGVPESDGQICDPSTRRSSVPPFVRGLKEPSSENATSPLPQTPSKYS